MCSGIEAQGVRLSTNMCSGIEIEVIILNSKKLCLKYLSSLTVKTTNFAPFVYLPESLAHVYTSTQKHVYTGTCTQIISTDTTLVSDDPLIFKLSESRYIMQVWNDLDWLHSIFSSLTMFCELSQSPTRDDSCTISSG